MLSLIRTLTRPLLSLVLLILASGLGNTFISVRLEMEGYTNETIGIITSALYAGMLLGSMFLDRLINKAGHIRSFIVFALVSAVLILAQSFWIEPYYWGALRFIGGICIAGVFIVIESWILMQATPATRGVILSVYLAVFYAALSAGQFLIRLSDPMSATPFYLVAFLSALSITPLIVSKIQEPRLGQPSRVGTFRFFKLSPFGFLGGVISGMLLATIYGLVPAYAKEIGMSVSEISDLMALIILGGLCFQWPLGRLADRGDRRFVLIAASFFTGLSALCLAILEPAFLLSLGFIFGGFSFTIYPLSMAYVCEKLTDDQIISATGGFVLSYGIGAISGPLLAPLAMNFLGSSGLFYFLSSIAFVLVLAGLKKPVLAEDPEE